MVGELELTEKKLVISEDVEDVLRKKATSIGNGAHVLCPKKHVGKTVYLVVCRE